VWLASAGFDGRLKAATTASINTTQNFCISILCWLLKGYGQSVDDDVEANAFHECATVQSSLRKVHCVRSLGLRGKVYAPRGEIDRCRRSWLR
jgi:hypothetical protein